MKPIAKFQFMSSSTMATWRNQLIIGLIISSWVASRAGCRVVHGRVKTGHYSFRCHYQTQGIPFCYHYPSHFQMNQIPDKIP